MFFKNQNGISKKLQGFTLVEVVCAMGIAAFGLITLITLMAQTLNISNRSVDETASTNIAQQIITDLQRKGITETIDDTSILKDKDVDFPTFGPFHVYFDIHQQVMLDVTSFDPDGSGKFASYKATIQGFATPDGDNRFSNVLITITSFGQTDRVNATNIRALPFYFLLKNPDA